MKKLLFLTLLVNIGYIHSAAVNPQDTKRDEAILIIGIAWTQFSESWKDPNFAPADYRTQTFSQTTRLKASIIYASDQLAEFDPENIMPAVSCRPGLTGLKIGKDNIECFIQNPTDPIEELTMQIVNPFVYSNESLTTINKGKILWPTIWHFLASEKGKQIVQEYLETNEK